MKPFRLLQIGDVHFSPERLSRTTVDLKDMKFPPEVASLATEKPLQGVLRLLAEHVQRAPVDAILIVGDLTDKGNLENYQAFVKLLSELLDLPNFPLPANIHCVPGNHDINQIDIRKRPSQITEDFWTKFKPLQEAWDAVGMQIMNPDQVRTSTIEKDESVLTLYSLNSCLGCGEYYQLDDKIRQALYNSEPTESDDELWRYREQLDTPSFASAHIDSIIEGISERPPEHFSVVTSHHNLLPQALPRIAPYAELINGGRFRTLLADTGRPVIYCHGHIHNDPVEIVGFPERQPANIITVSAPELDKGFNIIELFSSKEGTPVGVEIQKFRISSETAITHSPNVRVRIPLKRPVDYYQIQDSDRESFRELLRGVTSVYGREIVEKAEQMKLNFSQETIEMYLVELQWFGFVNIINLKQHFRFWKIQNLGL